MWRDGAMGMGNVSAPAVSSDTPINTVLDDIDEIGVMLQDFDNTSDYVARHVAHSLLDDAANRYAGNLSIADPTYGSGAASPDTIKAKKDVSVPDKWINILSVDRCTISVPVLTESACGLFAIHQTVMFNGELANAFNVTHIPSKTAIMAGVTHGGAFAWASADECGAFMEEFSAQLSSEDIIEINGKWVAKTRIKVLRDELIESMQPRLAFMCEVPHRYVEHAESAASTQLENEQE